MLKDTGERIIPKLMKPTNGMLLEHIARYYFSIPYAKGRVLDIACGTGYGSQMIAKARKKEISELIGVDICKETLNYAKGEYYHPLITFTYGDVLDENLPESLGTFDTVLSFETLEHISNDELFMRNMYNLLNPGGTLIISTPFGQGKGEPCGQPFHVHQFTEDEFKDLFDQFSNVEFYYQHGVIFEPQKRNIRYPFGIAVCQKLL
ncbi:class I SAM-dependent methyltransferase [Bacillus sp. FJAT-45350]|uniref:class I SAM-dependent methyltransferase n=1 Tax=Bacillus sp. FJAT-45350 TaxID=2011014 RepID=UPI000BB776CE|nr:class I SAM-dependent methyltransferase [Bacillus sp. FJAT-45350]